MGGPLSGLQVHQENFAQEKPTFSEDPTIGQLGLKLWENFHGTYNSKGGATVWRVSSSRDCILSSRELYAETERKKIKSRRTHLLANLGIS